MDAKLILLIDYLQTGDVETFGARVPKLYNKKVIFHQENAPVHKEKLAITKLKELDSNCFRTSKEFLCEQRFSLHNELAEGYFEGENHF